MSSTSFAGRLPTGVIDAGITLLAALAIWVTIGASEEEGSVGPAGGELRAGTDEYPRERRSHPLTE